MGEAAPASLQESLDARMRSLCEELFSKHDKLREGTVIQACQKQL